jgi:hypothetical protein
MVCSNGLKLIMIDVEYWQAVSLDLQGKPMLPLAE